MLPSLNVMVVNLKINLFLITKTIIKIHSLIKNTLDNKTWRDFLNVINEQGGGITKDLIHHLSKVLLIA